MNILLEAHKNFLLLLLKHKVEFILIGGYAVIYYGYERGTADMDIWLKPDNNNREKFAETLKSYGIIEEDIQKVKKLDFTKINAFHIGKKPNKIDFLTKIVGVNFTEADQKKVYFMLSGKQVPVISYHHLITNKMLSVRLKDKADVEELQKIVMYKKK